MRKKGRDFRAEIWAAPISAGKETLHAVYVFRRMSYGTARRCIMGKVREEMTRDGERRYRFRLINGDGHAYGYSEWKYVDRDGLVRYFDNENRGQGAGLLAERRERQ